ncbi:MAG: hypothetical protein J0I32_05120 [Sphingobacteriales bacterium]|nr:hypothetical protein [Sphingobacteriales bacterium]OJW04037.1 MAG: hypothetical protein BGO52_18030 [Sphingobacteriales bacterium 44-61]
MRSALHILTILLIGCHGTANQAPTADGISDSKKITVSFTIDDSLINIKDKFQVAISNGNTSEKAIVKGNEISLPELKTDTGYTIIFKYADVSLSFKRVTKKMIVTSQDMEWKFGIDNRPFNNLLGLLSTQEFNTDKKTRQLQYLTFDPQEHGDGISAVNKIE